MSVRFSPRLLPVLAGLTLLPAGCGSDEVKVQPVAEPVAPPPKKEARVKNEVTPRAGSSAGMKYNPGGPPPGADTVD